MSTNTRKIKIYSVRIQDINCELGFETEQNHLEKEFLLKLPNPKFQELQNTYVHLKDLQINNHDPKSELSVYAILNISDYTNMETQEQPRVDLPGKPIPKVTKFGLVIGSPGQETRVANMLFFKTSLHDYEKLWSLNCLSIKKRRDDSNFCLRGISKIVGAWTGVFYQTNLIWKDNHSPLKNNKTNRLCRLSHLLKNLTHRNQLERYDNIIQYQFKRGIAQKVVEVC